MGFEINDVTSKIIQRGLAETSKAIENSIVRISYSKQTKAMENAANLMISEGMEAQRRGSQQAAQNVQMGLNLLSTAESGLSSVNDNLQRIRELAVQRENGTYSESDKAAIDAEIKSRMEEIDRVSKSTSYNDIKLLDGSANELTLQVGPDAEKETNTLNVGSALGSVSTSELGLNPEDEDFINKIDSALERVTGMRSDIGAMSNRLGSALNSLYVQNENLTAAQSRLIDVDMATEMSKLTQNQILQNASTSLMAQANQSPGIASILL